MTCQVEWWGRFLFKCINYLLWLFYFELKHMQNSIFLISFLFAYCVIFSAAVQKTKCCPAHTESTPHKSRSHNCKSCNWKCALLYCYYYYCYYWPVGILSASFIPQRHTHNGIVQMTSTFQTTWEIPATGRCNYLICLYFRLIKPHSADSCSRRHESQHNYFQCQAINVQEVFALTYMCTYASPVNTNRWAIWKA